MWIAKTTAADGIAIVVFATVIFLILVGLVTLAKWLFRLISGRPNPAKMETVVLVLESELREDLEEEEEENKDVRNFALYLHSKLAEQQIGHLVECYHDRNELFLCFTGPDANRIWEAFDAEVRDYSPKMPQRVVLECAKKNGGKRTIDHIPWQPGRKPDFQPLPEVGIPEALLRLSRLGSVLTILGFVGLVGWRVIRMFRGETENDFVATALGMFLAYLVGTLLACGLSLTLICKNRIKEVTKVAGFTFEDSSTSSTLKYLLLIVIAIFGLILFLV